MKRILHIVLVIILALGGGVGLMSAYPQPAAAATLTVTTTSDTGPDFEIGASLGDDESDGDGLSLREAIYWASTGETVTFDSGLSESMVTLNGTQLTIDKDITLDGDLDDDGAPDITISGNNTSRVFRTSGLTAAARLEGFTITSGFTHDSNEGGGMYNWFSSPTVTNCIFSGNWAYMFGGGMYNWYSSPTITNCVFSGNTAEWEGGGIVSDSSSPTITNCTFSDNNHGGMYNWGSSPTITNCTFSGNYTNGVGGGMINRSSSPTITNCTFSGNYAYWEGGGMFNVNSSLTVTNCILWGDSGEEIWGSGVSVTYSDVQGGYFGTGNIDEDPLFDAGEDFHLSPDSPCIDAGINYEDLPETDADGNPRIFDGNGDGEAMVDMGAYEYCTPQVIATQGLIEQVGDLVDNEALNPGQGNSLTAKLEAALHQMSRWHTNPAINQLEAFINQVNAFIKVGTLSQEDGQALIDLAEAIIAVLLD